MTTLFRLTLTVILLWFGVRPEVGAWTFLSFVAIFFALEAQLFLFKRGKTVLDNVSIALTRVASELQRRRR